MKFCLLALAGVLVMPVPVRAEPSRCTLGEATPDTEIDGEGGYFFRARRDYFWGWFTIDELRFSFDSSKKP